MKMKFLHKNNRNGNGRVISLHPSSSSIIIFFLLTATTTFLLFQPTSSIPLPEESDGESSSSSSSSIDPEDDFSPPSLIVLPDKNDPPSSTSDGDEDASKHKRHPPRTTPSPEELEERRVAFIKSLGGGDEEGGGGGGALSSLAGLGSLATDLVMLVSSNANETFAPLREARQRARQNFPDIGTQINRAVKNGREYTGRAYRGLTKTLRVTSTNVIRFILQIVTRLASTFGGLYQVLISLLDVTTRGLGTGARIGASLLARGSGAAVNTLARGTQVVRNLTSSGLLLKPINQAVGVGRGFAKGLSEDLFDKVEWTQESLTSKLELAQALAPNFLLRAHENANQPADGSTSSDSSSGGGESGYSSKLHGDDDDPHSLLALASAAAEMMQRGNRGTDEEGTRMEMDKVMKMLKGGGNNGTDSDMGKGENATTATTEKDDASSSSSIMTTSSLASPPTSSTTPAPPPHQVNQTLLNDIFGLGGGGGEDKMTRSR